MQAAFQYAQANRDKYLDELKNYLAIQSISSDPEKASHMQECAEFTRDMIVDAGITHAEVKKTEGAPAVVAEWLGQPGKPTVLIYGHYDVQPVDPIDLWEQDPFKAHIKNDRIIARGSADDKGQIFMHIKAVQAILEANDSLPVNIKFLIEGEEEIGSPNLPKFLSENKELLNADIAIVSDGQMWAEGIPAITYGLRGLTYLQIDLTGPNRDLHSGSYGGVVANPAEILARMLASVKSRDGRIQIPGFYDKVIELNSDEKTLLDKVPFSKEKYMKDLEVDELWGEAPYTPLEQKWGRPSFEVNGIWSGFTGVGAKTVLPSKASAKISMRLVPDQDPDEIATFVEGYFRGKAPKSVKIEVNRFHGGHPVVVPLDNPFMRFAAQALEDSFGREPLYIREGGSIPIIAEFKKILGLDTLLVGFCLPDAKAHSPNENMHLPSLFTGIETIIRFLHLSSEK